MKYLEAYVLLLLFVIFAISCTEDGITDPDPVIEGEPRLELVRLEGELGKSSVRSSSSIDFGEIPATKSQYYLLLNKGTRDAFDINFSSEKFIVSPSHIDVLPGDGSESIESLPIVEITAVHVLPSLGVGELQPMVLGDLSDSVRLNYSYLTQQNDTSTIVQYYNATGYKVGCRVDVFVDTFNVYQHADLISSGLDAMNLSYEIFHQFWFDNWNFSDPDSIYMVNTGNVGVNVQLYEQTISGFIDAESPLLDIVLQPTQRLQIIDYNMKNVFNYTGLYISPRVRLSSDQYVISLYNNLYVDGAVQFEGYINKN